MKIIEKSNMVVLAVFAAALLIALLPSCTKKKQKEKEPNNSFAEANPISIDSNMLGYMDTPHDKDFYVLNINNSALLDIQVSGVKGINLAIKIWKDDNEPKLIKWIDDNRKSSPERFPNLTVFPGRYYIEIFQSDRDSRKTDKENAYELSIKSREAISEESEPNDSIKESDKIYPEKEKTGFFSPSYNRMNIAKDNLYREEDWYVLDVNLKSDSPALLDVALSGVSGVNSLLFIHDPEGMEIAMSDNGGLGEGETITGVGIKKSGSYYIMATSKGFSSNSDEPYTLKAAIREHDPSAEMERNDDLDSANKIINNFAVGKINSRDDRDFFLYQVNGPCIFRIELRPPEDMDAMLTLFNSDKEKIIDLNNSGRGKKEVFPNFYATRDFYIQVSSKAADELPKGEYLLSVTPFKNIDNQELEPNNEPSLANRINGRVMTGYISSRGDKDYFLITSEARVRERFEVSGVQGGEIKVSITDPMGYIIKSYDVVNDRKVVFAEMIDKKGYLLIEAVSENYDNPYTIILRGDR